MSFVERYFSKRSRQREALERRYGVRFADHDPERDAHFEGRSYTQQDIRLLERQLMGRARRRPGR